MIKLASDALVAVIDPSRGADVRSLVHRATSSEVLLQLPPPRGAAELAERERACASDDSQQRWLGHYRGGWQTLLPVAGSARELNGMPVGFHGEASVAAWAVGAVSESQASLSLNLAAIPVAISRTVRVTEDRIEIADELTNVSEIALNFDYAAHPAFGGQLLNGACLITSPAGRFSFDPDTSSPPATAGESVPWPIESVASIPATGHARALLGWIDELGSGLATIANQATGLSATVDWDAAQLPYAWIWQELGSSAAFPWFARTRTVAIEPATCQAGGAARASVLVLKPGETRRIAVGVTVRGTRGTTAS